MHSKYRHWLQIYSPMYPFIQPRIQAQWVQCIILGCDFHIITCFICTCLIAPFCWPHSVMTQTHYLNISLVGHGCSPLLGWVLYFRHALPADIGQYTSNAENCSTNNFLSVIGLMYASYYFELNPFSTVSFAPRMDLKLSHFTPSKLPCATWWPNETMENGSRLKLKFTFPLRAFMRYAIPAFQTTSLLGLPYQRSTGLHIQKAHTSLGTSSMQILLFTAHACMHFAWELQLDTQYVHLVYAFKTNCNQNAYMHEQSTIWCTHCGRTYLN